MMPFRIACLFIAAAALGERSHAATQSVSLKPGWNSIWLTVDPADTDPAAVFAGLPVQQAWCWFPVERPTQFIDNPASGLFNVDGWRVWMPETDPKAFLSNLAAIQARRPVLIKLGGLKTVTLTITGEQTLRPFQWRADSFNLVGFDVDPAAGGGPAGAFFMASDAHRNQPIYRLGTAGTWAAMPASEPIRAGEAYWVYSRGPSDFGGAIKVATVGGPSAGGGPLSFGENENERVIRVTNQSAFVNTVTINNTTNLPLVNAVRSNGTVNYNKITNVTINLAPGESHDFRVGGQRQNLPPGVTTGTIEISGGGAQLPMPVQIVTPAGKDLGGGMAGLWAGAVELTKVNDVNDAASLPMPTQAKFTQRLLVHVDSAGQARLLKQVTVMRKFRPAGEPVERVLITDDRRLSQFNGATLKDGQAFGLRIAASGFDFAGSEVALAGAFGGSLTGKIVVGRTLPTNPLRHKFHPDHDDLDANFAPLPMEADPPSPQAAGFTPDLEEVWTITRDLALTFDPPSAGAEPEAGYSERVGTYRETLSNLHRQAIVVEGRFTLRRLNTIAQLNPAP